MLLVASYVFYGVWSWKFLSLIAISTVVDYAVGLMIHRTPGHIERRWLLALSCEVNLGILGYFKYCNFFVDSFVDLLSTFGFSAHYIPLTIVLPMGISFYTFQTMSYTIDIYRGKLAPTHKFLDFSLYVAFFPQLVAGPIERASTLLPQVMSPRSVTWDRLVQGSWLVLLGFFNNW
jgi:alginate O-acetyltransferase complex protein AlgI